jgi:subtilisin family serine protease
VKKQAIHYIAVIVLALTIPLVSFAGQLDNISSFDAALESREDKLRVIAMLDVPEQAQSNSSELIGDGEWLSLGSYIEEAQVKLANEMGWKNFNDIVQFKTVPAVAKAVSREEMQRLLASDQVKTVFEDKPEQASLLESTRQISLPYALQLGAGGKGQTVAVIDSGVDSGHKFLKGKVVAEACFSSIRSCPGGQKVSFKTGSGQPCQIRGCDHGTHVAGIAVGKSEGRSGVAPEASLIAVQVFSVDKDGTMGSYPSDQMQALEWLGSIQRKHNLVAINMSLGGSHYSQHCDKDPRKALIDRLRRSGVATIVAAGNEEQSKKVGTPSCISSAISVGALDKQNQVANYSNSYRHLTIMAPGGSQQGGNQEGGILSSVAGNSYNYKQGTSMAAPHVAGAWAVLKSAHPNASVDQILRAMTQGSGLYKDPRNGLKFPVLDLKGTLTRLSGKPVPHPEASPKPVANRQPPAPAHKPAPKPTPKPAPKKPAQDCTQRIDGVLIERTDSDCSQPISW